VAAKKMVTGEGGVPLTTAPESSASASSPGRRSGEVVGDGSSARREHGGEQGKMKIKVKIKVKMSENKLK
jgi:hypothetical protein